MVKSDSKIFISLRWPKSLTQYFVVLLKLKINFLRNITSSSILFNVAHFQVSTKRKTTKSRRLRQNQRKREVKASLSRWANSTAECSSCQPKIWQKLNNKKWSFITKIEIKIANSNSLHLLPFCLISSFFATFLGFLTTSSQITKKSEEILIPCFIRPQSKGRLLEEDKEHRLLMNFASFVTILFQTTLITKTILLRFSK